MRTDSRTNAVASSRYQTPVSPLPDIIGLGGAVAGLVAGLAMAIAGALVAVFMGGNIWIESKAIAAPFFGPLVMRPGFQAGPVIVGTLLHFATSALLGSIYSILTRRILKLPSDVGVPVLAGLIYGFLLWIVAYFVVLPLLNPFLRGTYAPAFIAQHLVFGIVLGLVYGRLRPKPYTDDAPVNREF